MHFINMYANYNLGRKAMQRMMQAKREASKERMQCHEDSSCHEVIRESRAAADCTNGNGIFIYYYTI